MTFKAGGLVDLATASAGIHDYACFWNIANALNTNVKNEPDGWIMAESSIVDGSLVEANGRVRGT